mmetsp:Transcript_1089/g.3000  ORF Transcript_1089/g.3000 Transcript_1089/m.3000 type:complete len:91 (+) Transcript_1089:340-612(+)
MERDLHETRDFLEENNGKGATSSSNSSVVSACDGTDLRKSLAMIDEEFWESLRSQSCNGIMKSITQHSETNHKSQEGLGFSPPRSVLGES